MSKLLDEVNAATRAGRKLLAKNIRSYLADVLRREANPDAATIAALAGEGDVTVTGAQLAAAVQDLGGAYIGITNPTYVVNADGRWL